MSPRLTAAKPRKVESVRIDRWLCAARLYKSRTLATKAVDSGQVRVNGQLVKASYAVKVGDELRANVVRGLVLLKVLGMGEKRLSAKLARELYEDHSPPPPPKEELYPTRTRGAGRPTKAERRALEKFRGGF